MVLDGFAVAEELALETLVEIEVTRDELAEADVEVEPLALD